MQEVAQLSDFDDMLYKVLYINVHHTSVAMSNLTYKLMQNIIFKRGSIGMVYENLIRL